jgi:hypothetical protein
VPSLATLTSRARLRAPSAGTEALVVAVLVLATYDFASIADALRVGALTDDGVYVALGRALSEGRGYHSIHLVGAPVQVKYPPGFPAILAVLWSLGGSVEAVQYLVGLLHPVVIASAAGLLWWLGRARLAAPRALLALFVILPLLLEAAIEYYTIALSEPWMVLGWAGVLALWLGTGQLEPGRRRLLWLTACGGLCAVTILIRAHAIVLLPAIAVGLLARRHRPVEWAVMAAMVVVPLGLWHWYHAALLATGPVSHLPDESPYLDWMHGTDVNLAGPIIAGMRDNAALYFSEFSDYLSGISVVGHGLAGLLMAASALGAGCAVRREPVLGLSALGGLVMLLLWPFAQDRLLLPVLPFLGLAAVGAVAPLLPRWPAAIRRYLGYACALMTTAILLRQPSVRREAVHSFAEGRSPAFFTPGYVLLLNSRYIVHASYWVRHNTRLDDRLMIDNHSGIYLYSGRRTVPANPAESRYRPSVFAVPGQYLATRLLRDSLTYVIVGLRYPGIVNDLEAVSARCPGVLTWGGTSPGDSKYIYQVRRDDTCLRSLAGAAE